MAVCGVTCPRPRPATYDAGAGIDKNASLLGLLDAMVVSLKVVLSLVAAKDDRQSRR